MDITQSFYDDMASRYDKLFLDWEETTVPRAGASSRSCCYPTAAPRCRG